MLHILNGDGIANKFKSTSLPGEVLIWREILSEGPAVYNKGEAHFWEQRTAYISEMYKVSGPDYQINVLQELDRLAEIYAAHEEIILWFEHDLLCQVNLLYLLHWFSDKPLAETKISLVSINQHPEIPNFKGLGELSPAQLTALFPARIIISDFNLKTAHKIWLAYSLPNPLEIQKYIVGDIPGFPFLPAALTAHLQRFPAVKNGLNKIEETLLDILREKTRTAIELFIAFWARETIFGLGDSQILDYVNALFAARLVDFTPENIYQITDLGKKILAGEDDYLMHFSGERWLGGYKFRPRQNVYRWDENSGRLVG